MSTCWEIRTDEAFRSCAAAFDGRDRIRWAELLAGQIPRSDEPYLREEQDDLNFSGYIAGISADGVVELDVLGPQFVDEYFSMAGYLGADTAIGPLFVGAGFTTDGQSSVFMHFGRSF